MCVKKTLFTHFWYHLNNVSCCCFCCWLCSWLVICIKINEIVMLLGFFLFLICFIHWVYSILGRASCEQWNQKLLKWVARNSRNDPCSIQQHTYGILKSRRNLGISLLACECVPSFIYSSDSFIHATTHSTCHIRTWNNKPKVVWTMIPGMVRVLVHWIA